MPASPSLKLERAIATVTGASIIFFTMYLVVRNAPFASPDLARMMRIILSLGIGIIGGTIPGFLNVSYNGVGFAVRAGGALALFVITYFGSPSVDALHLGEPIVETSAAAQIDLRTIAPPNHSDHDRLEANTVITVPLHVRNINSLGKPAFIERTEINFPVNDGEYARFIWRYFVNMHEEARGVWLSIQSDAQPQVIPPGGAWNSEVLHFPNNDLAWADTLKYFTDRSDTVGVAIISITYSNAERLGNENYQRHTITVNCTYDLIKWRDQILRFRELTGKEPGRVTMECREAEV